MATPGWTPDALAELLTDPPGTWRHPGRYTDPDPDANARIAEAIGILQSGDEPVIRVNAVTPVESVGGKVLWESWWLPVETGSVTWTDASFPAGTADIEVASHLAEFRHPGPQPTGGRAAAHPLTPTLSPFGVPWCVLPFGTIVAVYRGWRRADGSVEGLRIFDGVVVDSSYIRPSRRWRLQCADFTHLMARTAPRWGETLHDVVTAAQGGPGPDADPDAGDTLNPTSTDSYRLSTAILTACREAGEFWAPMPDTQLEWDEPSVFDVRILDGAADTVPAYDDLGAQPWQRLVEDWCDAAGLQARMAPGRKGVLQITEPDRRPAAGAATDLHTGSGGVVVGYSSGWQPAPNRLWLALHTQQMPQREGTIESAAGGEGADWTLDGNLLTVRPKDLTGPNVPMVQWVRAGDSDVRSIRVPPSVGQVTLTLDWGADYYVGGADMFSDNDGWDDINISVPRRDLWVRYGFANRHAFDNPSSVRRTGRVAWMGDRQVSRSRLQSLDDAAADLRAERMLRRIAGDGRSISVDVKPLPWLMPGHTVHLDLGDGAPAGRHLVGEVTIPLNPRDPMVVRTRDPDGYDDP